MEAALSPSSSASHASSIDIDTFASSVADAILSRLLAGIESTIAERHATLQQRVEELLERSTFNCAVQPAGGEASTDWSAMQKPTVSPIPVQDATVAEHASKDPEAGLTAQKSVDAANQSPTSSMHIMPPKILNRKCRSDQRSRTTSGSVLALGASVIFPSLLGRTGTLSTNSGSTARSSASQSTPFSKSDTPGRTRSRARTEPADATLERQPASTNLDLQRQSVSAAFSSSNSLSSYTTDVKTLQAKMATNMLKGVCSRGSTKSSERSSIPEQRTDHHTQKTSKSAFAQYEPGGGTDSSPLTDGRAKHLLHVTESTFDLLGSRPHSPATSGRFFPLVDSESNWANCAGATPSMLSCSQVPSARVEELRRRRAADLTRGIVSECEDMSGEVVSQMFDAVVDPWLLKGALDAPPPLFLRFSGIFSWRNCECSCRMLFFCTCYKWIILLFCTFAFGACLVRAARQPAQQSLLSDMPLALGSIAGLLSFGVPCCSPTGTALDDCRELLIACTLRAHLIDEWTKWSRWDLIGMIALWICAVLERARGSGALSMFTGTDVDMLKVTHVLSFTIFSGVVMSLAFCLLWVSRALQLLVDSFCCRMQQQPNVLEAVRDWNVVQAVLRKASNTVEKCFFVMQTAVLLCVLLSVVDSVQAEGGENSTRPTAAIPGALVALGIGRVFFAAAAVSDKCSRVPSWVNSLTFGAEVDMDLQRQYVVDYIIHSDAGFYIFEVRLTAALALKVTYLIGVVASYLATQLLSPTSDC